MKKSLCLLTLFTIYDICAVIVFLRGAAGKTSISEQITSQDHSWNVVSADDIYLKKSLTFWRQAFPEQFAMIETTIAEENIYHAINREQILFKKTATEAQRAETETALNAIRSLLDGEDNESCARRAAWYEYIQNFARDHILAHAECQKNLIVDDAWLLNSKHIEEIKAKHEVKELLLYTSLNNVIHRTALQNINAVFDGDLSRVRHYFQRLWLWNDTFSLTAEPCTETISALSRGELDDVFDKLKILMPAHDDTKGFMQPCSRYELSRDRLEAMRKDIAGMFQSKDVCYIKPKCNPDFIIDTNELTSREVALKLFEMLAAHKNSSTSQACSST